MITLHKPSTSLVFALFLTQFINNNVVIYRPDGEVKTEKAEVIMGYLYLTLECHWGQQSQILKTFIKFSLGFVAYDTLCHVAVGMDLVKVSRVTLLLVCELLIGSQQGFIHLLQMKAQIKCVSTIVARGFGFFSSLIRGCLFTISQNHLVFKICAFGLHIYMHIQFPFICITVLTQTN